MPDEHHQPPTPPAESADRSLVALMLQRAGLPVDESEMDDIVEMYRYYRETSAILHSDRATELTGTMVS